MMLHPREGPRPGRSEVSRSRIGAVPRTPTVVADDLALALFHPLAAALAEMHPLSAGGRRRDGCANDGRRRARARLHAAGTLPRMADDWQDLEFLRHVFDETQVVRKPLTGIITGYHVLPYILVRPEHDQPGRSVEVRGRIKVSPRLVIGAGGGPAYRQMFPEAALIVLFLAVLAGALAWRSRGWPLIHDAALMHYIAWRIGEGAVPYRDLFDMNFPGVYLLHMIVLKLFGSSDAGWRAFDLIWLTATSLAAAALAAPWGRLAAAGAGLFFAVYHLAAGAWQTGQRDFLLCPFLLLAALGVARWAERPGRPASLAWGGLALGAGITVKPHAGLFAAALLVFVAVVARRTGRSVACAAAILAAAVAVAPAAATSWLAAKGALAAWREIVFDYLLPL